MASSKIYAGPDIRRYDVNSSNPVEVSLGPAKYGGIIVMGFIQNFGGAVIAVSRSGNTVTARNLVSGAAWSSSSFTFEASSNGILIRSDQSGYSRILVIHSKQTYAENTLATSTIKVQNAVSEYKNGSLKVSRSGTVVTINGYWAGTIKGETAICNLSQMFRPGEVVRAICNVGSNAYSAEDLAYVSVTTGGYVTIVPKDSSKTYSVCYMSLSWTV